MHPRVSAVVETTYGTLRVCADDRRSVAFRTADRHDSDSASHIVLCRVEYRLRLDLASGSSAEPGTAWADRPAEVPALNGTGFVLRQGVLLHSLIRVDWQRPDQMYGTDAARLELTTKLLPQLAAWLATGDAAALLAEAERRDLDALAAEATTQATALRAAADELDGLRARALAGDDLDPVTRSRIRRGVRLAD